MALVLPSTYTVGTATVDAEGVNVTGQNTFWGTGQGGGNGNPVLPGDFFGTHVGFAVRILDVIDDTHLVLANPWPGDSQAAAPYEVMLTSDMARVQESTRRLLQQLQNGNIEAFTGLEGAADRIPMFTGPGAMTTIDRNDLVNGINFDVTVETLADRAAYDGEATGFSVFVGDIGDGRAAVYFKRTATSGDWSDPAFITGERGLPGLVWRGDWSASTAYSVHDVVFYDNASWVALAASTNVTPVEGATWDLLAARGAPGRSYTSRGTYNAATAYAIDDTVLYQGSTYIAIATTTGNAPPNLPATSNAWWQLQAQRGTDGTGIGDVVGPSISVDNRLVVFDGNTGKLIKDSGSFAADFLSSQMIGPALKGRLSSGAGAVADLTVTQVRNLIRVDNLAGMRNKLINGDFVFFQRSSAPSTGISIAAGASAYVLDRWLVTNGTNQSVTISQQPHVVGQTGVPGNPLFKLRAAFSVAPSSGVLRIAQRIESVAKFSGIAASARGYFNGPIASEALAVEVVQNFGTGGSPSTSVTTTPSVALNIANIYDASTQLRTAQFNIPSISGKTLGTVINNYLELAWVLTPRSIGNYELSHMSIVEGDASSEGDPFSPRDISEEEMLCRRYRQSVDIIVSSYASAASQDKYAVFTLTPSMRGPPTVTPTAGTFVNCTIGGNSSSNRVLTFYILSAGAGIVYGGVTSILDAEL